MLTKITLALALALPALASCAATGSDSAGTSGTSSGPPTPVVGKVDVASADFQSKWWTWAGAPEQVNPVSDSTGEHCGEGQPGDVWLVAGSFGGSVVRQCTIPYGLPIAGPLVNLVAPDKADCEKFMADADGTVSVEGSPEVVHVEAVPFEYSVQKGNPFGERAGQKKGYGCGIWFSVAPLPAGRHQLVIKGNSGDFSVQATYNLTVKAVGGV